MRTLLVLVPLAVASSCGSPDSPSDEGLSSNMTLHNVTELVENAPLRDELDAECAKWKGSQRPPMSWPSVVVQNCNSVDGAKQFIRSKKDIEELRKGMGI
ncbi:hypothetical protein KZ813_00120 [Sphingomonas sp. RHCKR7]|uniref:hypothetical protein n=1 Tax=Sphingomonas folli TaxID=2862497 RepID=UPI001CA49B21|nr:hypothetical protein [Sphingomonas folli]MBW6525241.1 hypothetical protein [Sphingomonas folli]